MAGGPSTPALVLAAGSWAASASWRRLPDDRGPRRARIASVRAAAGAVPFGVNLFAPNPVPVDAAAFRRYAGILQPEADPFGLNLREAPIVEDG